MRIRSIIRWLVPTLLALLLGSACVQYLVTHPLRMDIYLGFCFAALFAIAVILARYFVGTERVVGIAVCVTAFAVGWYTMTGVVLSRQDDRPMPELTRAMGDPGKGHTAVVYLTHGEPPVYDPISWVNQMNEFDEQGIDKSRVGVLLVAHGQPDEWDDMWPLQTEHEVLFGQRIMQRFEKDGFAPGNLGRAWMSYKEPKPAREVERIFANGVDKLFFMSYTISAAGMHSQYDIPALVYEAEVPDDFPIVNLGAWGNDPLVIQALKEKIDQQFEPVEPIEALSAVNP